MKFLSASGRLAMARRNGLGCLARLSRPARNSLSAGSTRLMVVAIGTSINAVDEFAIAGHEIQAGELEFGLPAQIVKDQVLRLTEELIHAEEDQLNRVLRGIGVVIARDELAGGAGDAEFLFELARQGLLRGLAGLDLAAGELPFQRMGLPGRTLSHQNFVLALQYRRHHLDHLNIGAQRAAGVV